MATDPHAAISSSRFRLNEPAVVADIIDGEAVIMNLERGNYYALDRNGAAVWRLIVAGFTPAEIAAALVGRYGLTGGDATRDVAGLARQLADEALIVATDGSNAVRAIANNAFAEAAYVPAKLAVYSDMKDLLALDPPLPVLKPSAKA